MREGTTIGRTAGGVTDCEIVCRAGLLKICQKSIKLIRQQDGYNIQCVFRCYDSRLFSCRFTIGSDSLEGQLVKSRVPQIAIYLCTYLCMFFHRSAVKLFMHVFRAFFCWSSMNKPSAWLQPTHFDRGNYNGSEAVVE